MPVPAAPSAANFPTTQWTVVLALKDADGSLVQAKAMRELCQAYWFPLYAFARHRRLQSSDAEDAVQNFFASTGDADFFQKAEQHKGKLRTFILTAFTRMLSDYRDRNHAQKRGGGQVHLSIDAGQAEEWLLADPLSDHGDSTLAFERHWAKNIIRSVLVKLEAEASVSPKSAARFQTLSRFLSPEGCLEYTIRQAAADLDISVASCEKSIQRLRAQFRHAVRQEVANTLKDPTEAAVTEEMVQLQKALLE